MTVSGDQCGRSLDTELVQIDFQISDFYIAPDRLPGRFGGKTSHVQTLSQTIGACSRLSG
jgi:hypothetical protein